MSHSQWVKNKMKKEANGKDTHKIFTKMVRLLTAEAKNCGGNREAPGLKAAILKAKREGLPTDNVDRAIKKASEPSAQMETITYEAYGPAGVGIIIEVLTDSKNRSAQDIRHIMTKHGFALGGIGSVVWSFTKELSPEGLVWKPNMLTEINSEEDATLLQTIIDELENYDDVQEVFTNAE
ncbi:MAG: YebC/PmpR family DNA-binding transcriptional regulator [Candidatus Nomurabacteria bacterium]|nr:YebC/PmpR family DNA-binding transcriptional regulator [Candidatus Nomurabacteria bacterium]